MNSRAAQKISYGCSGQVTALPTLPVFGSKSVNLKNSVTLISVILVLSMKLQEGQEY
jgi:hypothetical protein